MSRLVETNTQVRQVAVQVLYQLLNSDNQLSIEDAVDFALSAGQYPNEGYQGISEKSKAYLYYLVQGVLHNQSLIDKEIEKYLTNWTMERIAKIDAMILRIITFELTDSGKNDKVPSRVVIDEGIELAKFYSDDKSRRFVTGVLGNLLADYQKTHKE